MAVIGLPGGVVSMETGAADKLLALCQGDAALLYVAFLRYGGDERKAAAALGWARERVRSAYAALQGAGLVEPAVLAPDEPPRNDAPPEYGTQDVVAALSGDSRFASLVRQVENHLGTLLSPADLKQLYTIYDFLAMPPEVILLLTAWCVEEYEKKYGQGRRPRVSQIKKAAWRWHDQGIDTFAAAEDYLRRRRSVEGREGAILAIIGVRDRPAQDKEREYMAAWVDWGFPDESIALAYQRTLLKKQSMSWPYMNSILRNWHAKGLHTPREIEQGDGAPAPASPAPGKEELEQQRDERLRRNIAALKRKRKKKQEEG